MFSGSVPQRSDTDTMLSLTACVLSPYSCLEIQIPKQPPQDGEYQSFVEVLLPLAFSSERVFLCRPHFRVHRAPSAHTGLVNRSRTMPSLSGPIVQMWTLFLTLHDLSWPRYLLPDLCTGSGGGLGWHEPRAAEAQPGMQAPSCPGPLPHCP